MQVDFAHWPYPRLVAHRGAGREAPENTLAAFRLGASHGFRMFEFDVKLSRDQVPFLLHDAELDRTTDGVGTASRLDWAALASLDAGSWLDARWAGEPPVRLATIARYLQGNGFHANVEIKPTPGDETETGRRVAEACLLEWQGADVPPLLTSFSESAIEAARLAAPGLPRGLLFDRLPDDWVLRLERQQAVALAVNHRCLDAALVREAHRCQRRVLCYTVNDPERVAELQDWGVDCFITDAVDRIPVKSDLDPREGRS